MRRAGIKETSKITGLSEFELRNGAKSGKYPHYRIGNSKTGRIIFDIDLLEEHIKKMMLESITSCEAEEFGQLRKVK